ncbi:LemA family protein [Chitinibacter sp. FCG-7]|uniref:LemA family protein n=1 Tax=Chitinibacter mangrovi TaxID=3153927 RepID=A0AAU7F817_9NEIS
MKRLLLLALLSSTLTGCGYNTLQAQDENVNAAWSEVLNQYQRRADLVPNLVNVVKGYAAHEEKVLIEVTEARAKVSGMQITPELAKDEAALAQFQQAQAGMTSALSRLMVVVEKYPDLKANQNFLDLSAQLEGTENRITVARNRYIESVRTFNTTARSFPTNLTAKMFDLNPKPNFKVENEKAISNAPSVDFTSEKK